MPKEQASKEPKAAAVRRVATRRPRGEPRRLLVDAARELFARRDYRSTTTREIAEAAGVTEHLLFRSFGSKAALFREAVVLPFVRFVDDFDRTWRAIDPEATDEEDLARQFVGQLYDLFVEDRGLLVTLLVADAFSETELEETGLAEARDAIVALGQISAEGMDMRGIPSQSPDLPAHSTVAMIAGMAALGSIHFGIKPPTRDTIVEELTQASLHGFLHRPR